MKGRADGTAKQHNRILANSKSTSVSNAAIAGALQPFGIAVSSDLAERIRMYMDLLHRWNRKVNLTSITDTEEILVRHFGESMFAAEAAPIPSGHVVDVGSGAGFPGLALKLIRPELLVTLIEPVAKKRAFLGEVIRTLGLRCVELRGEPIGRDAKSLIGARFVTARAIGHFAELLEWAGRSLAEDGRVVLWLGEADVKVVRWIAGWSWNNAIPIPKSERRVLAVGRRYE